ncbi:MAG: twitching motility protein PilT [Verrucomicrobia bacterium]|nr:twitching motility protein PilT [Verrucomicrobiota bacterium]
MNLWPIRIFFILLCAIGGYATSQVRPEWIDSPLQGFFIGFGLGGVMIAIDEMLKGFSLRVFSATTLGLGFGSLIAWLVDQSGLFEFASEDQRWLIRICLFLAFSYLGIILAIRSNKEDLALLVPYVRFQRENKPVGLNLLDTSAIIDGRIADLADHRMVEGVLIIPRFVLRELQQVADSADSSKRARGRRGLEMLDRLKQNQKCEVRVHEIDFPEETGVDDKLVSLAQSLDARIITADFNLAKVGELRSVRCLNLGALSACLKPTLLPGDVLDLRLAREGKEKGQAVGYTSDGTLVVVNHAADRIGQTIPVRISALHQTGAGSMIFADATHSNGQSP